MMKILPALLLTACAPLRVDYPVSEPDPSQPLSFGAFLPDFTDAPQDTAPLPPIDTGTGGDTAVTDTDPPPPTTPCDAIFGEPASIPGGSYCRDGVAAVVSSDLSTWPGVGAALEHAVPNDTVTVCPGIRTESLRVVHGPILLVGYGSSVSVLSGGGNAQVISVDPGVILGLQDLGVQGGKTLNAGGGLASEGADLCALRVEFHGNKSAAQGGAIAFADGRIELRDCAFTGNVAGQDGGAIHAVPGHTSLTIQGSTFVGNRADGSGGGLRIGGETDFSISDTTFDLNSAGLSGGALQLSDVTGDDLVLESVIFTRNHSSFDGGALILDGLGRPTVQIGQSVFSANQATRFGGAVRLDASDQSALIAIATSFEGNEAEHGGALHLGSQGDQYVRLTDCTVASNNALAGGGAFALMGVGSMELLLESGDVTGNSAGKSGGAAFIGPWASMTLSDSDWGGGSFDNAPDDIFLVEGNRSYTDLDAASDIVCSDGACE